MWLSKRVSPCDLYNNVFLFFFFLLPSLSPPIDQGKGRELVCFIPPSVAELNATAKMPPIHPSRLRNRRSPAEPSGPPDNVGALWPNNPKLVSEVEIGQRPTMCDSLRASLLRVFCSRVPLRLFA